MRREFKTVDSLEPFGEKKFQFLILSGSIPIFAETEVK
jgi:hypothetical protein